MFAEQEFSLHTNTESKTAPPKTEGFESRIQTDAERQQRANDLQEFSQLISVLSLEAIAHNEILDQAKEVWLLTNPLASPGKEETKEYTLRFKAWRRVNPNIRETNWQHTLLMIKGLIKLYQLFPTLTVQIEPAKVIQTILWHDTIEFYKGDVDTVNQDSEQIKENKRKREETARRKILEHSRLGLIADKTISDYEERQSLASRLTKALDLAAGNKTFHDQIVVYLGENLEQLATTDTTSLSQLLDKNYQLNGANFKTRINGLLQDFDHMETLIALLCTQICQPANHNEILKQSLELYQAEGLIAAQNFYHHQTTPSNENQINIFASEN